MATGAREVASADGFRVSVTDQGRGRSIVIVHPGGGSALAWSRVAQRLETRFRVFCFDRRPYLIPGAVDPTATMENEVNDVLAVAAIADEPIVVVGHSSGGVVALEAALAAPALFAGIVLYEPPVAVTEPLGGDALVRAKVALTAGDPGRAMEIHLREIVRASSRLISFLRLVGPFWRRMAMSAPGQIQDDANLESLGVGIDRYANLNMPALLLGGARSPKHLRARLDALASVLPNVDSVVILRHQGHTANAFAPSSLAHIIEPFAARVLR
jgi:pimeloyl-ACP methyl ester carboxylesterase